MSSVRFTGGSFLLKLLNQPYSFDISGNRKHRRHQHINTFNTISGLLVNSQDIKPLKRIMAAKIYLLAYPTRASRVNGTRTHWALFIPHLPNQSVGTLIQVLGTPFTGF